MQGDGTDPFEAGVQGEPISSSRITNIAGTGCTILFLLVVVSAVMMRKGCGKKITVPGFPRQDLREGLLSRIDSPRVSFDAESFGNVFFVEWPGGKHLCLLSDGGQIDGIDGTWPAEVSFSLPGPPGNIFRSPASAGPPFIVVYGPRISSFDFIGTLDAELRVHPIHEFDYSLRHKHSTAVLSSKSGDAVILATLGAAYDEAWLYALDLSGSVLRKQRLKDGADHVQTHPGLPGALIVDSYPSVSFFRWNDEGKAKRKFSWRRNPPNAFRLARTSEGEAIVLVSYDHRWSKTDLGEAVVALDDREDVLWKAYFPARVSDFVLLEYPGKEPLVAALTWDRLLSIFDLEGTILYSHKLQGDEEFSGRKIVAGRVGSEDLWIVILERSEEHFYRVDISSMPDASNAAQEK